MEWKQIPLGPLQTNAYVLTNEHKEAIIFDPGGDGTKFNHWLADNKLKPLAILLTHAHFDHIGAVDDVRDAWSIPVYLHKEEKDWLPDPSLNRSAFFMGEASALKIREANHLIEKEGALTIGPFHFDIYETPGHSPGSVSFYHKDSDTVFSGDALFSGSIGRTDLPGGNMTTLLTSIHDKLLKLPEKTTVACGHGPVTTIEAEMNGNPFLNGF